MGRAAVEEGDGGCSADCDGQLQCAAAGRAGDCVQGEHGRCLVPCVGRVSRVVVDLHALEEEDVLAELWPREYFSLQLKQSPWRRRSAISSWVRCRCWPSPRPWWAAAGGRERQQGRRRQEHRPRCVRGNDATLGCPRRGRRRTVGLHQLHLPGQTHGRREGLQVVDANGMTERRQEATGEQLDALRLIQAARTGQECLEAVSVLLHGPGAPALRELEQRGRPKGRAEPKVQEFLEAPPGGRTFVFLELCVPELRHVVHVVGRHPHTLFHHGTVLAEIRFTLVDEE